MCSVSLWQKRNSSVFSVASVAEKKILRVLCASVAETTGLEIPSDVRQSLSILRGGLPGARWIDPENYHVTLRFIGDVDDVIAHEVASLLGRVRREPFELRVEDLKSSAGASRVRSSRRWGRPRP